ncbi:hypothetical protein [Paludibacterium yongneupense]|uniref:hypothetical protein n=1 Tax=Paludibacterium yongneupense TaxID=400061 RepID=UPI0004075A97|nr:hypothetical protein [Paludibacterium yongneupense]
MILGAVGQFVSDSGGAILSGTSSMIGAVAHVVEAHPLLAAVATIGAYELFGNNPDHLGQNVDTKA